MTEPRHQYEMKNFTAARDELSKIGDNARVYGKSVLVTNNGKEQFGIVPPTVFHAFPALLQALQDRLQPEQNPEIRDALLTVLEAGMPELAHVIRDEDARRLADSRTDKA